MRALFLLLVAVLVASAQAVPINSNVKRLLDLTKHVVREQVDIEFLDADAPITDYIFTLPMSKSERLSYVTAKSDATTCAVTPKERRQGVQEYAVTLPAAVSAGESSKIKLTMYFTRMLMPLPAEIRQSEDQLVTFQDAPTFSSPYDTKSQTTKLKLQSSRVESFTEIQPTVRKGRSITYGPYEDVSASSNVANKDLLVHFKSNAPFMTVTNLVREIEVSMWGRVSVEEVFDMENTGARLQGGFSRFDFTFQSDTGNSFQELHAQLPKDAVNVYYRDQIGNISTSRLRPMSTSQELELRPRFPLFGGWRTQFYLGYAVPTHSLLTHVGDAFRLKTDFSTSLKDAAVDDLTVKVILPEGSTNIHVNVPFSVESEERTTRQTYLDTPAVGRPVIILRKENLISAHNVPFEVTFDYPQWFMLHEPLLLVSTFLLFFLLCMVLFRTDVSLVPKPLEKKKLE